MVVSLVEKWAGGPGDHGAKLPQRGPSFIRCARPKRKEKKLEGGKMGPRLVMEFDGAAPQEKRVFYFVAAASFWRLRLSRIHLRL